MYETALYCYSGHITERQVTAEREHRSSKTVTCHGRTRRVNESDEWTVTKVLFNRNLE